ncbi:GNAT family N-acetyltransferase [Clostridium sp. YIM B02505]|uniref:GNAT family N-acetyltransferase n=1 Tax=Clostridium yunnanense TaxID=2800325 RepID=A0ABS1ERY9_9CLOT|nr:GNAT family N-acetyltransferase [Clostridium yunnanense]MBK1812154.1 GNAT family N-acetyltransferase [Clostridium yunnanense]
MDIEIRKLVPELAEDYVRFFDTTPHDDNVDEHKCYCVCWCNDDFDGKDFSTAEKRRKYALQYVRENNIQGYLAYSCDKVVGWCNANTKSDCLKCASWRRFMDYVPLEESNTGIKVKSIFCFVIAPEMKRKGIATLLLEHVCKDAVQDDFDFVEAYPYKESSYQSSDFGGHFDMYKKNEFHLFLETEQGLVMRKQLK